MFPKFEPKKLSENVVLTSVDIPTANLIAIGIAQSAGYSFSPVRFPTILTLVGYGEVAPQIVAQGEGMNVDLSALLEEQANREHSLDGLETEADYLSAMGPKVCGMCGDCAYCRTSLPPT